MKMKLCSFIFGLCFVCAAQNIHAQTITFEYDDAGNCTLKYKTVVLASHVKKGGTGNDTIAVVAQQDMIGEREVIIYPNPTQGALKIELKGKLPENPSLYILTDLNGRLLARKESTETIYTYDMTSFPAGVYLLQVVIDGKQKDWKIVKE